MKKLIIVLIIVTLAINGCVSQADFDVIRSELDAEKAKAQEALVTSIVATTKLEGIIQTEKEKVAILLSERDALGVDLEDARVAILEMASEKELLIEVLEAEMVILERELEVALSEIEEMTETEPLMPGGFNYISQLEAWIRDHPTRTATTLEDIYRLALTVQEWALEDGYLVNVSYDEDDTDPDYGWIFLATEVNGIRYIWEPAIGVVYDWQNWLIR